jgi:hypothetical protein
MFGLMSNLSVISSLLELMLRKTVASIEESLDPSDECPRFDPCPFLNIEQRHGHASAMRAFTEAKRNNFLFEISSTGTDSPFSDTMHFEQSSLSNTLAKAP